MMIKLRTTTWSMSILECVYSNWKQKFNVIFEEFTFHQVFTTPLIVNYMELWMLFSVIWIQSVKLARDHGLSLEPKHLWDWCWKLDFYGKPVWAGLRLAWKASWGGASATLSKLASVLVRSAAVSLCKPFPITISLIAYMMIVYALFFLCRKSVLANIFV